MIRFLRDEKKKFRWILWIIVLAFVLSVYLGMGPMGGSNTTEEAAKVGAETITRQAFFDQYRQEERRYSEMFKQSFTPEMKRRMNLPNTVLSGMIERILLRREAERLGLRVTDGEVRDEILSQAGLRQDGKFVGQDVYRRMLAANGWTVGQYENLVREDMLRRKLSALLERAIVLPDSVLEQEYRRRNEKASAEWVYVPTMADEGAVAVTPEEVSAWYEKNKGELRAGERRLVKYLLVDRAKLRQQSVVSEEEARAEYAANLSSYEESEQVHARHILVKFETKPEAQALAEAARIAEDLRKGGDFAAIAKAKSEDVGSGAKGGDLGFFGRGAMVKPFDDAAFSAEPGEIVGPVKSDFGFHVIEVLERRPARVRPFEEVAGSIQAKLGEGRAVSIAKSRAESLAQQAASAGSDTALANMADPTGTVTFNTTEWFDRDDQVPGLGASPEVMKALFDAPVGKVLPEALETPRGFVIAKIAESRPAGVPPLDEVRAEAERRARREKAQAAVAARLAPVADGVRGGQALADAAKSAGFEAKSNPALQRTGSLEGIPGGGRAVIQKLFAAKDGEVVGPIPLPDGGVVLARTVSRSGFDAASFAAGKEELRKTVRQQESDRLRQSLLEDLRRREKVVVNQKLLEQLSAS